MIDTTGHRVEVNTTHRNHFTSDMNTLAGKELENRKQDSFFNMLSEALTEVNNKQAKVSELTQKMITNPEEVEIHDVMIALEKAKLALNFTRTIRDTAIKTYREITNLR